MKWKDLIRIDQGNPLPVYAQIEEQAARIISSGAMKPGDRLPSVRELAIILRVNPLTVAKAYGRLADSGLVETFRGRGVFVADRATELTRKQKENMVVPAVESLLAKANQLGIPAERVIEMIRERTDGGA